MEIAKTIRKAIQSKRLSIYQVAKDTGLNQSGLNRFYNGTKSELQLSTIQVLFDYLGLEIHEKNKGRRS